MEEMQSTQQSIASGVPSPPINRLLTTDYRLLLFDFLRSRPQRTLSSYSGHKGTKGHVGKSLTKLHITKLHIRGFALRESILLMYLAQCCCVYSEEAELRSSVHSKPR